MTSKLAFSEKKRPTSQKSMINTDTRAHMHHRTIRTYSEVEGVEDSRKGRTIKSSVPRSG